MSDDWDDDDHWDDDGEDWPDDADDADDADETVTVRCPSCGEDVYEDAPQCPYCGEFITQTSSLWDGRPVWWIMIGGLGIIATILALSGC